MAGPTHGRSIGILWLFAGAGLVCATLAQRSDTVPSTPEPYAALALIAVACVGSLALLVRAPRHARSARISMLAACVAPTVVVLITGADEIQRVGWSGLSRPFAGLCLFCVFASLAVLTGPYFSGFARRAPRKLPKVLHVAAFLFVFAAFCWVPLLFQAAGVEQVCFDGVCHEEFAYHGGRPIWVHGVLFFAGLMSFVLSALCTLVAYLAFPKLRARTRSALGVLLLVAALAHVVQTPYASADALTLFFGGVLRDVWQLPMPSAVCAAGVLLLATGAAPLPFRPSALLLALGTVATGTLVFVTPARTWAFAPVLVAIWAAAAWAHLQLQRWQRRSHVDALAVAPVGKGRWTVRIGDASYRLEASISAGPITLSDPQFEERTPFRDAPRVRSASVYAGSAAERHTRLREARTRRVGAGALAVWAMVFLALFSEVA